MSRIIDDAYNFEQVDGTPSNIKYDFVSEGERQIPKRVSITQYPQAGLEKYFNLGFSNFSVDEDGNEIVSDMSRVNNRGDKDKVLKTVIACALHYFSEHSDSILTFAGNTYAKHRLYKMEIGKYLDDLKEFLIVKGGIINDVTFKETEQGKEADGTIVVDNIVYELYDVTNSRKYSFITLELRKEDIT